MGDNTPALRDNGRVNDLARLSHKCREKRDQIQRLTIPHLVISHGDIAPSDIAQ